MRTIAAVSGAHVVGLTINEYQVQRAVHHNKQVNLLLAVPVPFKIPIRIFMH